MCFGPACAFMQQVSMCHQDARILLKAENELRLPFETDTNMNSRATGASYFVVSIQIKQRAVPFIVQPLEQITGHHCSPLLSSNRDKNNQRRLCCGLDVTFTLHINQQLFLNNPRLYAYRVTTSNTVSSCKPVL